MAAAPGPRSDAELVGRLPILPSPSSLPWLRLDLAGAEPGLFSGLSLAAGGVTLLRDADLAGQYFVDLTAALPHLVGQAGPLPLTVGLAGATTDRPGPATRLRSLSLQPAGEPSLVLLDGPVDGEAQWPDGVIRQGDRLRLRVLPLSGKVAASLSGPPRRAIPIEVEPRGDELLQLRLPDDLVAGPGELLLTVPQPDGDARHLPCWAAIDTRTARAGGLLQPVSYSDLRPTLDGAIDDRAYRDAAVLAGLGPVARILLLAQDDGLAIAARLRRSDGQPPRATATPPDEDWRAGDHLRLILAPRGNDGPRYEVAIDSQGRCSERTVRASVPSQPLLGAADGGWQAELQIPWTALGDPDTDSFGLAIEVHQPGLTPQTMHWPGGGRLAHLAGLSDLRAYRLPAGPPQVTVLGHGASMVELPLTNRTGAPFRGMGIAALERPDGLDLAESAIDLAPGETGLLRWIFKAGDGPRTLRWRIESPIAPTLRRTGITALK